MRAFTLLLSPSHRNSPPRIFWCVNDYHFPNLPCLPFLIHVTLQRLLLALPFDLPPVPFPFTRVPQLEPRLPLPRVGSSFFIQKHSLMVVAVRSYRLRLPYGSTWTVCPVGPLPQRVHWYRSLRRPYGRITRRPKLENPGSRCLSPLSTK